MKTFKMLLPETISLTLSFGGICYAVFAGSFVVGITAAVCFVAVIVTGLNEKAI